MDATSPISQAIAMLGGPSEVARRRGLSHWAVGKWRNGLPSEHVLWLAEQTGWRFTPHQLSPELYPNPTDALPKKLARSVAIASSEAA